MKSIQLYSLHTKGLKKNSWNDLHELNILFTSISPFLTSLSPLECNNYVAKTKSQPSSLLYCIKLDLDILFILLGRYRAKRPTDTQVDRQGGGNAGH